MTSYRWLCVNAIVGYCAAFVVALGWGWDDDAVAVSDWHAFVMRAVVVAWFVLHAEYHHWLARQFERDHERAEADEP